ncbi:MAG TPA: regulatory protein RecX [Bryobacteraceae bacterium]|nr:regulatory protein RecX [Bryobacteraceae bacterium]
MRSGTRNKPKPLDREGLMKYAARILSSRAQTISELRDKLKRRAADVHDADEVLARLKQMGYLNDQRFAEGFASWRRDHEGLGKTRVMRDLMARRVAPAVAKTAAEAAFKETDEIALIERFLERKYRGKDLGALLREEKHLASAYRKLRTAGFSSGNAIKALKRHAAEAENLEEIAEGIEEESSERG